MSRPAAPGWTRLRYLLLLVGIGLGITSSFAAVREYEDTGTVGLRTLVFGTVALVCLATANAGTWRDRSGRDGSGRDGSGRDGSGRNEGRRT